MTYELHLGDYWEYMKSMPDKSVDALITDPPYGIDLGGKGSNTIHKGKKIVNDDIPFDPSPLLKFRNIILWGANNFSDKLPRGGWIVWDKRVVKSADNIVGSPFELAWCLKNGLANQYKIIRLQHCAAINADGANAIRYHDTQKPIKLMTRCIELISKEGDTIFDPFMGSGTTGVACMQLGRNFIGCEIDPKYYAIAEKRIKQAAMQEPLFT